MKQLSAFYDFLLPDVRGCTPSMADVELRNAIVRLMEEGRVWVKLLDPILSIANEGEYDLDAPERKHRVLEVKRLWYNKKPLTPVTADQLEGEYDYWPGEVGTPKFYTSLDQHTVRLVPMPDTGNVEIGIRAAIAPTQDVTEIDDLLFDTYRMDIVIGAKAGLFSMKDKPWTDSTRAAYYLQRFEAAIGSRSIQAAKGFQRGRLRSRPQFR